MLGATFRKRRSKRAPLEESIEQLEDEELLHELDRSEVGASNSTWPTGAQWHILEGPTGRGECLVKERTKFEFVFLAPPGVPLQLPELTGSLKRWRIASRAYGMSADPVRVLELSEVRGMAPEQSAWIDAHSEGDRSLSELEDQPIVEDEGASSASYLPDRRRVLSVTKSASTFAELVGGLPSDSAFALIEAMANAADSRDRFNAMLGKVGDSFGEDVVQELVLALLHARARSHSWRYTWFLGWAQRRAPLQRVVGREVDRARTDRELTDGLASIELPRRELDQVLVSMLWERSRCLRWRITGPFRRALGVNSLSGPRAVLRHRVQPGYERLRVG